MPVWLAHKKGTAQTLKYKVHQSIDDYKRVILDCFVTTGAVHESQVYMDRLEHILKSYSIDLKEVVADRAYGSGELLTQISKKQIRSYISLFSSRSGSAFPSLEKEFYYDTYRDIFTCPSQVILAPSSYVDKGIKIYRAPLKDCRACLQKSRCHAHIMKKSGRRYVLRSIFQEFYNQVVQDMKRPKFIKKLRTCLGKV
ncbi:transposase [Candidatus Paracaedibacter symbiosus]|uniref:transposase n=1 Tax=Candidatus Paracaedibacter symbiosus TaxID=244582 RepID=UPI00068A06D3|nr:transposase [Candidatus Paracaedibacter symbiosus]